MKYFNLIFISLFWVSTIFCQNAPKGISYQATAYQSNGEPIKNRSILVQVHLFDGNNSHEERSRFIENHNVITNDLGIFKVIIGNGAEVQGEFNEVAWSEKDIWISVKLDFNGDKVFDVTQNEQLLAVPYAIHANTASELTSSESSSRNTDTYWRTSGNKGIDEYRNFIGTRDEKDFVFKTSDIERMRINAGGEVNLYNAKIDNVNIDNAQVNGLLKINDGANLLVDGESIYNGNVLMNNTLKVMSSFSLNGEFFSKKGGYFHKDFEIGQNFKVGGVSEFIGLADFRNGIKVDGKTILDELEVNNDALIGKNLTVNKEGIFNDHITVQGQTTLNDPLVVNDVSYLNNYLFVKRDASDGNYLATFENTNNENGDGIKIKLGKKRPVEAADDIPIFLGPFKKATDIADTVIRDIIYGQTPDLLAAYTKFIDPSSTLENQALFTITLCYMAQSVGNTIITTINDKLGLPIGSRDITVAINGCDPWYKDANGEVHGNACNDNESDEFDPVTGKSWDDLNNDWWDDDWVLDPGDGFTLIPEIPKLKLCEGLFENKFALPKFPDLKYDATTLSSENNFILFTDQNDKRVGAITGVSRNEFVEDVLNEFYVLDIAAELVGLDPLQMIVQGVNQVSSVSKQFNDLGVEYSSGHGDYAEWLPRLNKEEKISTGDIIAVKGGKITKDLTNAEQIMAVSHRPIILGNVPNAGEENTGNNIAFMGQIPVKVVGPIESGDYIVANNDGSGYGKGYNEAEMTLELLKYAVGRSWDTNVKEGPKLVNTVVGVTSGDYIKFLSNFEKEIKSTQDQLNELSVTVSKLSMIINDTQLND